MLLLMTALVGCGTRTEIYSVSVRNDTSTPLTIGFTKKGEPFEEDWMQPEDIALDPQINAETHSWGILVPAGKTATTKHDMKATLGDEDIAYLRVYRGHLNMLQILSISRGSPNRIDQPLVPGKNDLDIINRDGKLAVTNAAP